MTIRQLIRREAFVVVHGQSARFRIIKYIIIVTGMTLLVLLSSWSVALITLAVLTVLSIAAHVLFRWKTKGWTKSWGLYKRLNLPE